MNTRYLKALAGGMLALAITVPPATSAAKKKKVTKATTTVAPATTATTAAPATTPSAPVTTAVKAAATGGTGTKCNKVGGTFIDNWNLATSDAQHIDPGITSELIGAQISLLKFEAGTPLSLSRVRAPKGLRASYAIGSGRRV